MLKTPEDKNAFTHLMRDVIKGLPMVDGNDRLWKSYRETLAKAIELRLQIIRREKIKAIKTEPRKPKEPVKVQEGYEWFPKW